MSDQPDRQQHKLQRIDESHRCALGNTALLVIDMQHGFLDEGASLEVPKGRDVIANIAALIDVCRSSSIPVIFTEFVYAEAIPCLRGQPFGPEHLPAMAGESTGYGYPSGNCLVPPHPTSDSVLGADAESAATIDALKPRANELVLQAHTYDKFYGTHLDLALRSLGADRILATGVTTDVCVNSTIMSGATRNYRVTAVTDGMATIHDHIQGACFQIWENKFARLRDSAAVIAELADG